MTENRYLIDIVLEEPVIRRVAIVETERMIAISDLLEKNVFDPVDKSLVGPFIFVLSMTSDGLTMIGAVKNKDSEELYSFKIPLKSFRRLIKDYFQICESYYDAMKKLSAPQIETVDMARRAMHNEGADMLTEVMERNVMIDNETARRLFTLITVMHIRG